MLGASLVGYFIAPMSMAMRLLLAIAAIMMVATSWQANLWSIALAVPVMLTQVASWRRSRVVAGDQAL